MDIDIDQQIEAIINDDIWFDIYDLTEGSTINLEGDTHNG